MTDDHQLSIDLARAIGRTIADHARAHPSMSCRAALAAVIENLIAVGQQMGTLEDITRAVSLAWPIDVPPSRVSARPKPSPVATPSPPA